MSPSGSRLTVDALSTPKIADRPRGGGVPNGEQPGAHDAGTGSLAWRQSLLDGGSIVVVDLVVVETQNAPFEQPPAKFDDLVSCESGGGGIEVLLFRKTLEGAFEDPDRK